MNNLKNNQLTKSSRSSSKKQQVIRVRILLVSLMFTVLSCQYTPQPQATNTASLTHASWIEDGIPLPKKDSLYYLDHPAPLFRTEFLADQPIQSASLRITAAGYYKATINGIGLKENVLDPAWTDFSKRIYYSDYDVSSLIKQGNNCIGVTLGNGFYNPLPLRKWGRRNLRKDLTVGKPVFIASLLLRYENGETQEIVTDESWKFTPGPIVKNSVYLGVAYDATKEVEGWNQPGFDDSNWKEVRLGDPPGGQLEKAFFPPVEITKEITPLAISTLPTGAYVVDMGVNFTGTYAIKLNGKAGDTITFTFGERIYADGSVNPMTTVTGQIKQKGVGGPGAPDIAIQTDHYVIGTKKEQWFSPDFTYHTYRYMEIHGLREKPSLDEVRGLFMHTNVVNENSFSSASSLLNSIQDATERTFLANLVSVQSDCPAREKFGYGGDLNATSEAFIYNFDMQTFYRKTIYDWVDAMRDSTFVDTAPYTGIAYCGISWESAFLTTQYYLYLYYNDTAIIKELYALNTAWMDKVARLHPEGIINSGLSDHESLEPVPVQLTGTSHYLQCARIMKTFAGVMGNPVDEKKYEALAHQLKQQIKAEFWDKPVRGNINRQTLFATLLYHDIIPQEAIPAAKDSLLLAVKHGPSSHLNTGIFGTKYALETLASYGNEQAVFDIVHSTAYPGWGYMIAQGATSIWETWKESDNTFSNNHPMFGTVSAWFYRGLAGIKPDINHPGFNEFFITPTTPKGLDFINCTYTSPYGPIVSNWKKNPKGGYTYQITVPKGSKAKVTLPLPQAQTISILKRDSVAPQQNPRLLTTDQFTLLEGEYVIKVR